MPAKWRDGLTPEEQREAEMNRGTEVIAHKHGALRQLLAEHFDPDWKPSDNPLMSKGGKEYNRRLKEQNKNRPDMN